MILSEEIIEKFKKYQNNNFVHPFTCGICHDENLDIREEGIDFIMFCHKCNYTQQLRGDMIQHILLMFDYEINWEKYK